MCGITGILSFKKALPPERLTALAASMADRLVHRGPDAEGVWVDAAYGIALSHRRLSVIDLSDHARQPMMSASGRYVLSYNGEIYNFRELREELDYPWQSESDTEVILAAVEQWGLEKALQAFNGMFAFALWDRKERSLSLARDRMGEKPLYYGRAGGNFVFASELKAFNTLPGWPPAIDREALTAYMRYRYVPAPLSIYEGVFKLEPGSYLTVSAEKREAKPEAFWRFEEMVRDGMAQRLEADGATLTGQLETLLGRAVKRRMIADVPLGAFLSGGVDSSAIVALMQAQTAAPVKTFSIGFHETGYDEAPHARAVAENLGTDHTELYVTPEEARAIIPQLPVLYDEPFADSSQIPTSLVASLARQQVTVALSGDGGDECFGGYNRYLRGPALWRLLSALPLGLRKSLGWIIARMPASLFGSHLQAQKLYKALEQMDAPTREGFYQMLCSASDAPAAVVIGGSESAMQPEEDTAMDYAEWMMWQDALTYLPGDILTKVDRAAMGVSLETRIPFLDPEVMAFAWRLPREMKIRNGKGKWLLRQMLYRHVPEHLIERPKAGFAVPVGAWLRGPLEDWAQDLLSPERIKKQGFFEPLRVEAWWREHHSGARNREAELWNILMFQSWLEQAEAGEQNNNFLMALNG